MLNPKQLVKAACVLAILLLTTLTTLAQAPTITRQPANFTQIPPGTFTNLFVEAVNAERYQWYRGFSGDDSNPFPGETNATIITPRIYDQISFWVRVSNASGSTDSQHGRVSYTFQGSAPNFTNSPSSTTDVAGATITLRGGATGTQIVTYQWQKDEADIPGETNTVLVITNISSASAGNYRLSASNYYGRVFTTNATVGVHPEGYPGLLTKLPAQIVVPVNSNLVIAAEVTGAEPLSMRWFVAGFGNTLVFLGQTNATLVRSNLPANQGGNYYLVLSNSIATVTNVTNVRVIRVPQIASFSEADIRLSVGDQLNVSVRSYSGNNAPYTYQWFKDGVLISTNENIFKTAELADAGDYQLILSNVSGSTTSSVSRVTVFEGPVPAWITRVDSDRAIEEGGFLSLNILAQGGFPLHYTWYHEGEIIAQGFNNAYSTNPVALSASGGYYVVVTNSTGAATSAVMNVLIYPRQTSPSVQPTFVQTNGNAGEVFSLAPTVTGDFLSMQWFKQVFTNNTQTNLVLAGQTNASLTFNPLAATDEGTFIFWATNYNGLAQATYILTVFSPPVIVTQPQSQEATPFANITLSVSAAPFNSQHSYQWYHNGAPVVGRTFSSYNFNVSQTTTGNYYVVVTNNAGSVTSQVAAVVMVESTPASGDWKLVADRTIPIPGRDGLFFETIGDGKLHEGIVTFQGGTNFPDLMGVYRWDGTNHQVLDRHDPLPGFVGPYTTSDGVTLEVGGKINFVAANSNAMESAIFEWGNGNIVSVVDETKPIPSRPGLTYNRYGYPSRGGGKAAFLAMNVNAAQQQNFRSVMVWDGVSSVEWANEDDHPDWDGNSSQVGFDGNLLAFWAAKEPEGNVIFMTQNAGPLQIVATTGTASPIGGTFTSFRSPPHVEQGRILFNAGIDESQALVEWANGTLRVIAKAGDVVPGSVGGLRSVERGFYAGDGSIVFGASGPGSKTGIYRWKEGVLSSVITSLNTMNGRQIRFIFLDEASGDDLLAMVSFDGSRFGLWTTADGTSRPQVTMQRTGNTLSVSWEGPGALEETSDLFGWDTVTTNSPAVININTGVTAKFYRIRRD